MDTMIRKLTEIEETANRIMDGAAAQKKQLSEGHERLVREFDEEIDKETNKTVSALREELHASMKGELDQLRRESEDELNFIRREYSEHREDYAQEIFETIIRK